MAGQMVPMVVNDRPGSGGGPPQGDRPMRPRTHRRLLMKALKKAVAKQQASAKKNGAE